MYYRGNFSSNTTTGNRAITGIGFQPAFLRFTVSQKTNVAEDFIHKSVGNTDGTRQGCHTIYWDASGGKTVQFTDRVINHINRVSGALTDQIVASIVSMDADGFTLNFSATISGYRIHVEAFN